MTQAAPAVVDAAAPAAGGRVPARLAWLAAVRDPASTAGWSLADWERVIRVARNQRLLGRLAAAIESAGTTVGVPAAPARHLAAERQYSRWRTQALNWALARVDATLDGAGYPRVLLKGAAYIAQDLAIARGRLPSDVDILVPRAHLADAQARLTGAGWQEVALDAHDQHYYREWSHEAPPMRHPQHALELDLHHNILPPVARTRVDADLLLARLQPSGLSGWQVLHPADQVLHSAAHLFQDAEISGRLRDLADLDGLLRHFGQAAGFWDELPTRARQLGLGMPLALACHFTTRWLGTPVPDEALARIRAIGPGPLQRAWLLPTLHAVLWPADPDDLPPLRQELAATLLLARYHLTRMPLRLLLPHLWHKWRAQRRAAAAETAAGERR